jgi:hypothetical protein
MTTERSTIQPNKAMKKVIVCLSVAAVMAVTSVRADDAKAATAAKSADGCSACSSCCSADKMAKKIYMSPKASQQVCVGMRMATKKA